MKKKGLIISTVVMVVVLIAALTTGTYAWFTLTATANVETMNLTTQAAEGLQIASVTYSGGEKLASGSVSLEGTKFSKGDATTYGNSVDFSAALENFKMFGVTGNGVDSMLSAAATTGGNPNEGAFLDSSNKPKFLVNATENSHYFTVDLGIQNTDKGANGQKLVLGTFEITGDGAMAAAARIALIPIDPDGTPEMEDTSAKIKEGTTGGYKENAEVKAENAIYFIPYYDFAYSGSQLNKASSTTNTDITSNLKYSKKGSDDSYSNATSTTLSGAKIYKGTAAAIDTKIESWYEASDTTMSKAVTITGDSSELELGSYSAQNQVIFYRLVIWFEGEDPEAINAATGTGFTITISFTTKTTD